MTELTLPHRQHLYTIANNLQVYTFGRGISHTNSPNWKLVCTQLNKPRLPERDWVFRTLVTMHTVNRFACLDPAESNRLVAPYPPGEHRHSITFSSETMRVAACLRADALELPEQSAGMLYSSDCPTIVLYDPQSHRVMMAHAGRASLLPKPSELLQGTPVASVVDTMLASLESCSTIHLYLFLGIGGASFRHPRDHVRHRAYNTRLLMHLEQGRYAGYGCVTGNQHDGIDLGAVIRAQAISCGVLPAHIHTEYLRDTFTAPDYYSHRRGDNASNGVLVVRS